MENREDFEPNKPEQPEKLGILDDEKAAAAPKGRKSGGLDKENLVKFGGFVGMAALALGALIYVKSGSGNKKEEGQDDFSIAKPVEGNGAEEMRFNLTPTASAPVATSAAAVPAPQDASAPQADEAELARIQQEKAMLAAREKSSLMVTGNGGVAEGMMAPDGNASGEEMKSLPPELQALYGAMGMGAKTQNRNGQENTSAAMTQGGRFGTGTAQAPMAHASYTADRTMLIQQGKIADAVLETAVKSDIPSTIIARLTEDVYGEQGRYPLLPAGTRVFGEYSALVKPGQTEIAAIWRRAITPQGVEIMLDSPGTNNLGIVGMGGKVNNHFFRQFGTAALLSVFGAASANVGVNDSDQNNSAAQYRAGVAGAFNETSQSLLGKYADIPPTITVKHGSRIKILIAKDLDFSTLLN